MFHSFPYSLNSFGNYYKSPFPHYLFRQCGIRAEKLLYSLVIQRIVFFNFIIFIYPILPKRIFSGKLYTRYLRIIIFGTGKHFQNTSFFIVCILEIPYIRFLTIRMFFCYTRTIFFKIVDHIYLAIYYAYPFSNKFRYFFWF